MNKTCRKCNQIKTYENFTRSMITKDKLHSWCKECVSEYNKKYKNGYIVPTQNELTSEEYELMLKLIKNGTRRTEILKKTGISEYRQKRYGPELVNNQSRLILVKNELFQHYLNGTPHKDVARHHDVSASTITIFFRKHFGKQIRITDEMSNHEQEIKEMIESGKEYKGIAEKIGHSVEHTRYFCRVKNIFSKSAEDYMIKISKRKNTKIRSGEKLCTKCDKIFKLKMFNKLSASKDGLESVCRDCHKEESRKYRVNNKEKTKAYYKKRHSDPAYLQREKERRLSEHSKILKRKSENERYRTNHTARLNRNFAGAIYNTIKKNKNGIRWELLVPYTINDLKKHLKKKFQKGMTWKNYGDWHIDHIIPKSAFNFTTYKDLEFQKCWALENLQPLWASENLSKHADITVPFQQYLNLELSNAR